MPSPSKLPDPASRVWRSNDKCTLVDLSRLEMLQWVDPESPNDLDSARIMSIDSRELHVHATGGTLIVLLRANGESLEAAWLAYHNVVS